MGRTVEVVVAQKQVPYVLLVMHNRTETAALVAAEPGPKPRSDR
jgi:hypothetical protein